MKLCSKTLLSLPHFWSKKLKYRFLFSFWLTLDLLTNPKFMDMEKKKTIRNFLFQKYGNFWSFLVKDFIMHKSLISEEWLATSFPFFARFSYASILSSAAPRVKGWNHVQMIRKFTTVVISLLQNLQILLKIYWLCFKRTCTTNYVIVY